MEEKKISIAIIAAIYGKNIRNIKTVKDLYKDATGNIDISNIKHNILLEHKKIFEWILNNPSYDFNSLFETGFTNEELLKFFKVYYQNILSLIDMSQKGGELINPEDLD
jgi:hypothetical protein